METIIYVYVDKKDVEKYRIKEFDMGDYHLIRVGTSRDFLQMLQGASEKDIEDGKPGIFVRRFRHRYQERQKAIQRQTFVADVMKSSNDACFVCEEPIAFLEGQIFNGYFHEEWVMHMMRYASAEHYVILGRASCIPELIALYVKGMKSLRWILPVRQYGEAEENLIEDIYEWSGLAVELVLIESLSELRKPRPMMRFPVAIIDFTDEDRVFVGDLPIGSIWLDMGASAGKMERMEEQRDRITYFSLKKEWKQPQKALYQLDTTIKNGYNT